MGMKPNKVHCFFEQSGTFKKQFIELGIPAEDYDILNDFGQTDHVMDLFAEITKGFNNEPSVFDEISREDLIMAFFPCVRFEDQILVAFRGDLVQQRNYTQKQMAEYDLRIGGELFHLYSLINQLLICCLDRGLRLIIENPYSEQHFLKRYWFLKPSLIDNDRRIRGDYFKKPTQYWFVNCEPSYNFIFEPQANNACGASIEHLATIDYAVVNAKNRKVARSMIHPDYANRFIRECIL